MTSPITKLRFDSPSDWVDISALSYVSPDERSFSTNILASHEPHEGSLEDYADALIDDLEDELEEYEMVRRDDVTVAGRAAILIEHCFSEEDLELRQLQLLIRDAGTVFSLAITAEAEQFAEAERVFARLQKTVTIG